MENLGIFILFLIELSYRIIKLPIIFMEYTDKIIKFFYTNSRNLLQEINKTGEFSFTVKISRKLHNQQQEPIEE